MWIRSEPFRSPKTAFRTLLNRRLKLISAAFSATCEQDSERKCVPSPGRAVQLCEIRALEVEHRVKACSLWGHSFQQTHRACVSDSGFVALQAARSMGTMACRPDKPVYKCWNNCV